MSENKFEAPAYLENLFENYPLSGVGRKLISAIAGELGGPDSFTARHRINEISPSFPYSFRTLANRDAQGIGPDTKIMMGRFIMYNNLSLLEMLCKDLMKKAAA